MADLHDTLSEAGLILDQKQKSTWKLFFFKKLQASPILIIWLVCLTSI